MVDMEQHNHEHHEHANRSGKGLVIALVITGGLTLVEFAGGLISNSLALLSDAGHMFTDTLSLILSYSALLIARKPSNEQKTYGYYRIEILAAAINGTVLILLSFYLLYQSVLRFINPAEIKITGMLAVAAIGLIGNIIGIFFLKKDSGHSLNIRGAFLHMLSDTLSSVAVILGGIIIYFTGWARIDSILGLLISLLIIKNAWSLILESINILLESVPKDINIDILQSEVESITGIKSIHDLHIWAITSGFRALSCHLLIDDQLISESRNIIKQVKSLLQKKFNITHTTIELECEHCGRDSRCA